MTAIQATILSFGFCLGQAAMFIWDGWNTDQENRALLIRKYIDRTVSQIVALCTVAFIF